MFENPETDEYAKAAAIPNDETMVTDELTGAEVLRRTDLQISAMKESGVWQRMEAIYPLLGKNRGANVKP